MLCTFIIEVSQKTALSQHDSFSGEMVLKRPFVSDCGDSFAQHIHCSGIPGDRALN